jgi:hypothetical protein
VEPSEERAVSGGGGAWPLGRSGYFAEQLTFLLSLLPTHLHGLVMACCATWDCEKTSPWSAPWEPSGAIRASICAWMPQPCFTVRCNLSWEGRLIQISECEHFSDASLAYQMQFPSRGNCLSRSLATSPVPAKLSCCLTGESPQAVFCWRRLHSIGV